MAEPTFTPSGLGAKQWEELQQMTPDEVCRRAAVRFDATQRWYAVNFMDIEYRVRVDEKRVEEPTGEALAADSELQLLLLTYLLSAQDVPLSGTRVSERDLPGGNLFFRGPHALPTAPLIERFGTAPEKFLDVGIVLGGSRIAYGDVAIEFLALPRIPVGCVLWAEDEEFPARVTFLFDSSIHAHLPLDVVLALVRSVVTRVLEVA